MKIHLVGAQLLGADIQAMTKLIAVFHNFA